MTNKLVIPDDFPPLYRGHAQIERLKCLGDFVHYETMPADGDELAGRLLGADIVVNVQRFNAFDRALFERLPRLRLISIFGTGTDKVDLTAATELGIVVTNTPAATSISVAELNMGLLLDVARSISLSDHKVREGVWGSQFGMQLRGKTIGLIGLGAIGAEVARIALAFGMKVIGWSFSDDPARASRLGLELVDLDELLRTADVVSLHVRNTPEAAGMIGRREIDLIKPGAILINTARAAIVDQDALLEALNSGRIAGAGLDVHMEEPLPPGNPWVELENVVLTPHAGAMTQDAFDREVTIGVDNVTAFLEGEPTNVVNPAVMDRRR